MSQETYSLETDSMSPKPVVFIVDDDDAVRTAISYLVQGMGWDAQAFDSAEAFLKDFDPERLGCLLLDVRMPGMSGMELQAHLAQQDINLPIIMITGHGDVPMSVQAFKTGAADFIEKPFREQVLWDSIQNAMERAAQIRQEQATKKSIDQRLSLLTDRERQVMDILALGNTDKQVAQQLSISVRGVAFHRVNILKKMQVASLVELARLLPR